MSFAAALVSAIVSSFIRSTAGELQSGSFANLLRLCQSLITLQCHFLKVGCDFSALLIIEI